MRLSHEHTSAHVCHTLVLACTHASSHGCCYSHSLLTLTLAQSAHTCVRICAHPTHFTLVDIDVPSLSPFYQSNSLSLTGPSVTVGGELRTPWDSGGRSSELATTTTTTTTATTTATSTTANTKGHVELPGTGDVSGTKSSSRALDLNATLSSSDDDDDGDGDDGDGDGGGGEDGGSLEHSKSGTGRRHPPPLTRDEGSILLVDDKVLGQPSAVTATNTPSSVAREGQHGSCSEGTTAASHHSTNNNQAATTTRPSVVTTTATTTTAPATTTTSTTTAPNASTTGATGTNSREAVPAGSVGGSLGGTVDGSKSSLSVGRSTLSKSTFGSESESDSDPEFAAQQKANKQAVKIVNKEFAKLKEGEGISAANPNADIIAEIEKLIPFVEGDGDHWRSMTYNRTCKILAGHPVRIQSAEEAMKIKGIGKKVGVWLYA